MRIVITSTEIVTSVYGVFCRIWNGELEDGGTCTVFVKAIAAERELAELSAIPPPIELTVALLLAKERPKAPAACICDSGLDPSLVPRAVTGADGEERLLCAVCGGVFHIPF